ncbi:hypothetical protein HK098_006741 [Nowakowskiella sp. JEL0407]|nr:hypothetical protein HK098_006741 [Nowakowskiella sp. JEL0407]
MNTKASIPPNFAIGTLPPELIFHVGTYLPIFKNSASNALLKLAQTCREYYNILLPLLVERLCVLNHYAEFKRIYNTSAHFRSEMEHYTTSLNVKLAFEYDVTVIPFKKLERLTVGVSLHDIVNKIIPVPFLSQALESFSNRYTNLRYLNVTNLEFCNRSVDALGKCLTNVKLLEKLSIEFIASRGTPTRKCLGEFGEHLSNLEYLESCSFKLISDDRISPFEADFIPLDQIFYGLGKIANLRELTIVDFLLDEVSSLVLQQLIRDSNLSKLRLESYRLSSDIIAAIRSCTTLTDLCLRDEAFHVQHFVVALFRGFWKPPKNLVVKGDLSYGVQDQDEFDAFDGLESFKLQNTSFNRYHPYHNGISSFLIRNLANCTTLREFNCSIYDIRSFSDLIVMIACSKSLENLYIKVDFDSMYQSAVRRFFEAVVNSASLKVLHLDYIFFSWKIGFRHLLRLVSETENLETIKLFTTDDCDFHAIVSAVKQSGTSRLKNLYLLPAFGNVETERAYARIDFCSTHTEMRLFGRYFDLVETVFHKWANGDYVIDRIIIDEVDNEGLETLKTNLRWWLSSCVTMGFKDKCQCIYFSPPEPSVHSVTTASQDEKEVILNPFRKFLKNSNEKARNLFRLKMK